ncbi:MAG TPA: TonB family protein [Kofleriaceae bacterium]|nr:TonB family protein [Kofleriaceae bacterium]
MKRFVFLIVIVAACSKKDPTTIVVKPEQLKRVAGDADIRPDAETAKAMVASGRTKVITSWKVCVNPDGAVDEASAIRSSGFVAWDTALAAGIKTWQFVPLLQDGDPVRACTSYTFAWSPS